MVSARRKFFSVMMLACWSVLLTALTGVMGSIPLRGLRLAAGSVLYWIIGLSAAALLGVGGWWMLGLLLVGMITVVGLFSEFEERGHDLVESSFGAVIITSLMLAGTFAFWVSQQGANWSTALLTKVETSLATIPGWTEAVKIETKDILLQMPSAVVVVLVMGLFLSLLFQRRVMLMVGMRSHRIYRLNKFAVPDPFIWVLIAGVAGAFITTKLAFITPIGVNLLNIAAVVFYLQGLAVVASYFEAFRVGWIWQTLILILLVTQLFVLVSVVGLLDYWVDFRTRLAKPTQDLDRQIFKKRGNYESDSTKRRKKRRQSGRSGEREKRLCP